MSLLVMSTAEPAPTDRLSASWIRRISRQKSAKGDSSRPTTSNGLLSPRPASPASGSDDSRSAESGRFSRRGSVLSMVNRIRSSSNASNASTKSLTKELSEIENWFYGFRRYNQLVSAKTPSDSASAAQEYAKTTKALSKNLGGHFIHGMPEAAFDFSILWCPAGPLTRNDSNEPSWSRQAYDGPINFPFDHTTCPDVHRSAKAESEWFRSEVPTYHIGPEDAQYTIRRGKAETLRIKYASFWGVSKGTDAGLESNTLRFTAQTISADGFVAEQLTHHGKLIPCSQLLNAQTQHCGVIMDFESAISQPSSTGPFEFVLLSRSLRCEPLDDTRRPSLPVMHPPNTPIWDGERFVWDEVVVDFDEELFAAGPWKMLNVMLIKWVDGYAERVAVARIHEDVWLQSEPEDET